MNCDSCVLAALLTLATQVAADEETAIYVSKTGSDTWSGALAAPNSDNSDGPFATLERAVAATRTCARPLDRPVTVYLGEGCHFLSEPLTLTPQDSGTQDAPVTFAPYPGEMAVVSGGRSVQGWRKAEGGLWETELPGVKKGGWNFRTLRVGHRWAIRSRYPDFDSTEPIKGGWLFAKQRFQPDEAGTFGVGVHNIHNPGDRLEWLVDIPAEADYVVWVRYGHKMKDYGRETMDGYTAFGVVDGQQAPLVDMPDTGGWAAVRWAKAAKLHLSAGKQTLSWRNLKGGGLNLDAFCLSSDPDWSPAEKVKIDIAGGHTLQQPSEGNHVVLFHAETCTKAEGPEIKVGKPAATASTEFLVTAPKEFPQWTDWTGAELHIFPAWGWVNTVTEIHGVDVEKSVLRVKCPQEIRPGNRYFIAGTREALDSPGEWHLNRKTGRLTLWPTESVFPDVEVVAPVLDELIVLEGDGDAFVEHIRFKGLTFMDSGYGLNETYSPHEAAIVLSGARGCAIKDCTFTLLGGYAVLLDDRSQENELVGNAMTELGQGGVILQGDNSNHPVNNLIAANTITDCGTIYKHVAGVYVTTGSGNRIAHNRIHRMPRYGISLKSYNEGAGSHQNIVEYNELIDMNLETNDTGAIETLGRDRKLTGNVIRYNLIRNVVGLKTDSDGNIMSPYFTWGIYLDDYSSGTTCIGNIIDGTVIGGLCIHGGKDNRFENNIFLNASHQQLRLQPRDDFMTGNVFVRNITAFSTAESVLWYAYARTWRPDRLSECDHNLYWCYGDLDIATTDRAITPEGSFAKWQEAGLDAHSVIEAPRFVSSELEHFALKRDSPALKLGFKPIPEDKIGPEGFERR